MTPDEARKIVDDEDASSSPAPSPSAVAEHVYLALEGVQLRRVSTGMALVRRPGVDVAAELKKTFSSGPSEPTDITVSNRRVVFGNKTYALANISSVSFQEAAKSVGCAIVLIGLGVLAILCNVLSNIAVSMMSMGYGETGVSGTWIVVGLVIAAIGIAVYRAAKPKFAVHLSSNSGEVDGFMANDRDSIEEIHNAIQQAVIEHGP